MLRQEENGTTNAEVAVKLPKRSDRKKMAQQMKKKAKLPEGSCPFVVQRTDWALADMTGQPGNEPIPGVPEVAK